MCLSEWEFDEDSGEEFEPWDVDMEDVFIWTPTNSNPILETD